MHGISTWPPICKAKCGFHLWVLGIHCVFYSDHCIWLLRASTCVTSPQESPDPSFPNKTRCRPFSVPTGPHCSFHPELITLFFASLSVLPGKTGVQFRPEYRSDNQPNGFLNKWMHVWMNEGADKPQVAASLGEESRIMGSQLWSLLWVWECPEVPKFPVTLVLSPG